MSNRNEDRTLSGSTEMYVDILDLPSTINAIRIKNQFGAAGQVLSKNPTTNKLEFASVPIADDTIETNMIKDLAITNAKIANATIAGGKLAANIDIDTSGDIECEVLNCVDIVAASVVATTLTTTGNTTIGNQTTDIFTVNGVANFNNNLILSAAGTMIGSGAWTGPSLNVGSSAVTMNAGDTTINNTCSLRGEVNMGGGGSEVLNMDDHSITNCGSIAFTTGGDITNCDDITCDALACNSITIATGLTMTDISLNLGTGSLTANGGLNTTGASVIRALSCRAIDTNDNHITTGTGALTANGGITTTGPTSCRAIDTNNHNLSLGSGTITTTGLISANGGINTLNENITMGNGDLSCDTITTKGTINTTNNHIVMGTGDLTCDRISAGGSCNMPELDLSAGGAGGGGAVLLGDGGSLSGGTSSAITIGQITGTASAGDTADLIRFNVVHAHNDIPRLLAHKSMSADYSYSNTISTTYEDLDVADELLINFTVPPSAMVEVELYFHATGVEGETILGQLVDNSGDEFWEEHIDDESLCISTEDTYIFQSETGTGYYDTINYQFKCSWILKFADGQVASSYYIKPQIKVNTGSMTLRTGRSGSTTYPPIIFKITSLQNSAQFTHSVISS